MQKKFYHVPVLIALALTLFCLIGCEGSPPPQFRVNAVEWLKQERLNLDDGEHFSESYKAEISNILTALFGTGAVLQLLQIPVAAAPLIGVPQPVSIFGQIIILLWFIAVIGHIVSRALSKSFGLGVALAVAYVALSLGISGEIILKADNSYVETVSGNG